MAVAEASLRTFIDSMSAGLIELSALGAPGSVPPSMGTPSMTMSGSLEALSEAPPRMRIVEPEPGPPPPGTICTPAILPVMSWSGVEMAPFWKSLLEIVVMEPVRSFFCTDP